MTARLIISDSHIERLLRDPAAAMRGEASGTEFTSAIAIPDYADNIRRHYGMQPDTAEIPLPFRHFGLVVTFDRPTELDLYDEAFTLDDSARRAIEAFGPLLLRNAYLAKANRDGQRNIFPSLRFHVDRAPPQTELYSLFCRDPFDPVQKRPRGSSTLFIANTVGLFQAQKEGQDFARVRCSGNLFMDENVKGLIGRVILEQSWSEPQGVGEIGVLDSRTLLHASYYKKTAGYPIGVRYLS